MLSFDAIFFYILTTIGVVFQITKVPVNVWERIPNYVGIMAETTLTFPFGRSHPPVNRRDSLVYALTTTWYRVVLMHRFNALLDCDPSRLSPSRSIAGRSEIHIVRQEHSAVCWGLIHLARGCRIERSLDFWELPPLENWTQRTAGSHF
jgi:hypothetical protein